jgi:peptidoglycan/xylan/chitin deacetylase (PgdA/CDA1 family)
LADSEKNGYPFTLFVYTKWVGGGSKAMTWPQLEEMRDAGVDIEAHSVSHRDLRHAPRGQNYTAWLHNEIYGCKETLENKLALKVIAFAFPYGLHNQIVRKTCKEAGYKVQFTVYGRHMDINVPTDQIGRYAIDRAGASLVAFRPWQEGINMMLGAWLLISPWWLQFRTVPALVWSAIVIGLLVMLCSAIAAIKRLV